MFVLLLMFIAAPLASQQVLSPFQEQKARTMFRDQLPCLGCHELDGDGGRSAPSLTTVASRRDAAYIRAIVQDPQHVVPGAAMPRTLMPASTRELVIAYLGRNAQAGVAPAGREAPRREMSPQALYGQWCASCHGVRGDGNGPNARYLPVAPAVHASAARMSLRPDDALFDAIAGGGAVMGKSPRMPAFGGTLTPKEIRSLVAHIRALCACQGPAWSRDETAR